MASDRNPAPRRRRFDRLAFAIGCVCTAAVAVVAEIDAGRGGTANDFVFDQYQRWKPRDYDPNAPVRIIDIDRESLERFGQWPWPRTYLAAMVDRLNAAGAAVIGFDMLFAEPDRTSPEFVQQSAQALSGITGASGLVERPDMNAHDVAFARSFEHAKVVLGTMVSFESLPQAFKAKSSFSVAGPDPAPAIAPVRGLEMPLAVLKENAKGLGAIGFTTADGATARSVPLVLTLDRNIVPAFSLEALRVAVDARGYLLKSSGASGEAGIAAKPEMVGVRVGPLAIPVSPQGQFRIHYSGYRPERVIPAWKIMTGGDRSWEAEVAGRIVLVGSSAPGISQAVSTPLAEGRLGVEVQAEIIEQILAGEFLSTPYWTPGMERMLLILSGVLVTLVLSMGRPIMAAAALLACGSVIAWTSWHLFEAQGLLLGPLYPVLGAFVPFVSISGVNYVRADAEKRAIRSQFEHFVSPDVIAEISANPERYLTPGGEERELSILFCDVRGFSTITEGMDPQKVIRFVNGFLTPISEAVIDSGGTIDKYIGDAVMAFWNAPRPTEGYRADAVRAAFGIRRAVDELNKTAGARGLPEIDIGIGLNNGACSVGAMGSERRLEYSCIGDPVNLASRLEGLTKQYGVWNCVGQSAIEGLEGFLAVELDRVVVKGYTRPASVWTLLSDEAEIDPDLAAATDLLAEARAAFLDRRWDEAEALFGRLSERTAPGFDPKKLCANYLTRIANLRQNPPPEDWNGAFVASEK